MSANGDTPTTEQVRSDYTSARYEFYMDSSTSDPEAEFDCWLASVKAEAWDEGADAVVDDFHAKNPYRADELEGK